MSKWQQANDELIRAQLARENQNEGMARVCSRRAAGFALQGYLTDRGRPISTGNAITLLNDLDIRSITPPEVHSIMDHLLLKVDENYRFPNEIDLLDETKLFIEKLQNLICNEENNGINQD